MEIGARAMDERLESAASTSFTIATLVMTSFSGVTSASFGLDMIINDPSVEASVGPDVEARAANQLVKADMVPGMEMMTSDLPIEAGVGLDNEVRAGDQLVEADASPNMVARASS